MKNDFKSNLRGLVRGMLLVRGLEAAGLWATATGLVSVVVVWGVSWFVDLGIISLVPLVMMLIGGFAGAVWTILRGVDFTQVARFIDSRYALPQHLSTGAELLGNFSNNLNSIDSDVSACVYKNGLADLKSLPPRINFWILTRRTGFALLLTIAMCGLLAVGVLGAEKGNVKLSEISAVKRAGWERAYRDAAASEQNSRQREQLVSAADAIKMNDESRFNRIIQQLRREGLEITMGQVSSSGRDSNGPGNGESQPDINVKNSGSGKATSRNVENGDQGEFRVLVYDPAYFRGTSESPNFQLRSGLRSVPLQSAWEDACQKAASDLREGKVPAECRDIIRAFYE